MEGVEVKRVKPDLYSKQEDEKLWAFALKYGKDDDLQTQEALWEKAASKDLLWKRTAISIMKRYRQLKR